ncbi:MAG: hypothetical protein NVSMB47_12420 [Polyangiales bacterium]
MGYAWTLGLRYLRSKKRDFISVGTLFAILGVALGVAALATVMSVTGGFQKQFRDKVLGVNAHVLVLKRTPEFTEYREVMDRVAKVPGVIGVAPFVINPMLVSAGQRTATGVLMKGIDPERMPAVLDLPDHVVEPAGPGGAKLPKPEVLAILGTVRRAGAKPPPSPHSWSSPFPGAKGSSNPATSGSTGVLAPLPPTATSGGVFGAIPAPSGLDDDFVANADARL